MRSGNDLMRMLWAQQNSGPIPIPTNGLVFHASLNGVTPGIAETGQTLTHVGTYTYSTVDGIPCYSSAVLAAIDFSDAGFPSGAADKTLSFWVKMPDEGQLTTWFGYGENATAYHRSFLWIRNYKTNAADEFGINYNTNTENIRSKFFPTPNRWHCIAGTIKSKELVLYCDGVAVGGGTLSKMNSSTNGKGAINRYGGNAYIGSPMAGCRIYNRALSAAEIQALASEFHPVYAS